MNALLRNMMAQMESWEAANEFGIPEISWADYDARTRSDDLYISCVANIFDALRVQDNRERLDQLDSLAKALVTYSRSAAAKHLEGIERTLNQLYSAAVYYLADRPATANFLSRRLILLGEPSEEENFLRAFLAHDLNGGTPLDAQLATFMRSGDAELLQQLIGEIADRVASALIDNPRKFIATSLTKFALQRFTETNVWRNLQQHATSADPELWRPFFFNTGAFPMWELLPSQISALRSGLLAADANAVSLQMPTSAGKTSMCELLIFDEVKARGRRVLFLVPFRALASEIAEGMSGRLEAAGVNIIASYGGNLPTRSETASVETVDVLIVTPEKFTALNQVLPNLAQTFPTVICDEGHLIDDDTRGLPYELLLTKLRSPAGAATRKLVFMSAIVPNVAEIHAWLGGSLGTLARSDYKPVETDYAFLKSDPGDRWRLDINPIYPRPRSYFLKDFLTADDFRFTNPDTGRPKLISNWKSIGSLTCASSLRARRNGPVAVFTTTRGNQGIVGLARKFLEFYERNVAVARSAPAPPLDASSLLRQYVSFLLGADYLLTRLLDYGIAFHHGRLPQELRRTMEDGLSDGAITILICTSTLAEGVNMPIRTLVVHTFKRFDESSNVMRFIPHRTMKNIIGRVGRAGKETRGRIVFANQGERSTIIEVLRDIGLEPARGRLYRLIERIEEHFRRHRIDLTNEVLEEQQPWFLSLIDSIDHAIVDLVPENTTPDQIVNSIDELLERTLANYEAQSDALKQTLRLVFRLRGARLQQTVPRESWSVLKKTGSSPQLWKAINDAGLLNVSLWQTLNDPIDIEWSDQVVRPLLDMLENMDAVQASFLIQVIQGWLRGHTYAEIAQQCGTNVDEILSVMCEEIGFRLQDSIAKLCQLALNQHGTENLTETAQAWPSLLQFGLGTLQQLDLTQYGATDRLAAWGIQRFLDRNDIILRGAALIRYIRLNASALRIALAEDPRVPELCIKRVLTELRIPTAE